MELFVHNHDLEPVLELVAMTGNDMKRLIFVMFLNSIGFPGDRGSDSPLYNRLCLIHGTGQLDQDF